MRTAGGILLALTSCSGPAPAEEFGALMEDLQERVRALVEDSDAGRADAMQRGLARIRTLAEAARAIGRLRDEARREELESQFALFLDVRLPELEAAARDGEAGPALASRLQRSCRACHDAFKE